ncbi:MAG: DUF1080 domain-containing protein [Bacteroidales bacterium]|nr:DUF1080 domain-containing protein [Bacteroidales bacterium]
MLHKNNLLQAKTLTSFILLINFILFTSCTQRNRSQVEIPDEKNPKIAISEKLNTLTQQEIQEGWKLLFDGKTTEEWKSAASDTFPETGWEIKNGTLTVLGTGGGSIVTRQTFSDFDLKLEFRLTKGANSGIKYVVKYYPAKDGKSSPLGLEYQLLDDKNHPDGVHQTHTHASLYDLIVATNRKINPPGEWNKARIVVQGNHIEHWLNGVKVVEYERGSEEFHELVANSKYKNYENFGEHKEGYILLQDHGNKVSFRNIKIKEL